VIVNPGFSLHFYTIEASNWLSDASQYRGWNALGIGPRLGIGIVPSLSLIGNCMNLDSSMFLSIGYFANFAHYTQTTLYTGYYSWLLSAEWDLRIRDAVSFSFLIPIEFAKRADGRSIISGFEVGVKYAF